MFSEFDLLRFPEVPQNRLFLDPFKRFIKKGRNHFDCGWLWLTTAAQNKKWLIKKKISATRGIGPIRVAI